MRVAVLGIRGIPDVQGGVETHAAQLYTRLAELGCDLEVMVRTPFVNPRRRLLGRIRLRPLWAPRRNGLEALVHSILGVLYAGFTRPDILHIHAVGPAIVTPLARLLGLRVVVTHHGPDYDREKWGRFAQWVLRTGEGMGMRHSHARIAISKVIADLVRSQYDRESHLIPNGVIANRRTAQTDCIRAFALEPGRYFLQVSRIVPEKRQLDLIRAHVGAGLADRKLVLVGGIGTDAYSKEVRTAADAAGVVLTGFLHGAALEQMYSHACAFVLPSSHEGLPIALLEALSYGLPVLASDIPANLEVGLGSSSYFPVGDVTALTNALCQLAQTDQNDERRAERMRWVAEKYDWNRIAEQTLNVYRQVVA